MNTFESFNPEDTYEFAFQMAGEAKPGNIYLLYGNLGAGKTVFAKGFAAGLGITNHITSPTFAIVNVYEGRLPFYHFDLYRLEDADELYNIGYEDYIYGNGISLIEWPDRAGNMLPDKYIKITITEDYEKGHDFRLISVE